MKNFHYSPPPVKEGLLWCAVLSLWFIVTALFIGCRIEHVVIAITAIGLFYAAPQSRRVAVALVPFMIFGISYDWMNLLPNYEVNSVDTLGIYNTEKAWFGMPGPDGMTVTPNEFFALHTHKFLDFICGLFYLCWVPAPMAYGIYLYFKKKENAYVHFSLVFLLANLIGFALYYIHPATPPWYIAMHPGGEIIDGTSGSVAGLGAFDSMTGLNVFHSIYERNANVFAAFPSLHSAYTFIAFIYSLRANTALWTKITLGIITAGIWFTAVYTSHHYLIDVIGGILVALAAVFIFEKALMKWRPFARFVNRYSTYLEG